MLLLPVVVLVISQRHVLDYLIFYIYISPCIRHYGPSAPNVPGANLYSVSEKGAGYFLSKKINEHGYINFQIGGIPTGTAEVGGKKMKFFLFHFLFS